MSSNSKASFHSYIVFSVSFPSVGGVALALPIAASLFRTSNTCINNDAISKHVESADSGRVDEQTNSVLFDTICLAVERRS